jgi:hypothetical protein
MRRAVHHLHHFRVPVVRVHPILVARLVLPLAVPPPQFLVAGFHSRFLRQPPQILHVVLARFAPHQHFIAALASSVVASIPAVFPFNKPRRATSVSTNVNTAWWVAWSSRRRVREIVTWSGVALFHPYFRNRRRLKLSATCQAIPRSLPMPSQNSSVMPRDFSPRNWRFFLS